jgi:PX domain
MSRGSQPYVAYRIRIKSAKRTWSVERRFSDFNWLHDCLLEAFAPTQLPALPARRLFGDKMETAFIEERR